MHPHFDTQLYGAFPINFNIMYFHTTIVQAIDCKNQ